MTKSYLNTLAVVMIAMISFTACKTTSHTTVSTNVAGPTVIQKPVVADLEVGEERVTGTATMKGVPVVEVKEFAVKDAVTKAKVDVLVEPRYDVTKSFNKVKVDVSGYPAKYKNFRPMEAQDTIFVNKEQLSTTARKRKSAKNNRNTKKIVGITVGSVAAAIGGFFLVLFI